MMAARPIWQRLAGSVFVALLALAPMNGGAAGADSVATIKERFLKLYNDSEYITALAEAEKLVAASKVRGTRKKAYADALNFLGNAQYALKRNDQAIESYKKAISIYEKVAPDDSSIATFSNNMANVYRAQSKFADAEQVYLRVVAFRERVDGKDSTEVSDTLHTLGRMYYQIDRHADSERVYRRSLAIREAAYGEANADVATSLNNLALAIENQERYDEAEPHYLRAIAIREKLYGPDAGSLTTVLNNLAMLYRSRGRWREAEPMFKRALAIEEKTSGPDGEDAAWILNSLGELYRQQLKHVEAEQVLKRALAIREKIFGSESGPVASSLDVLGSVYRDGGRLADADPLLTRALAVRQKVFGPTAPSLATTLLNLGHLRSAQGRAVEAEAIYKRALAIRESDPSTSPADVAIPIFSIGSLYEIQDRDAEAEGLYLRALPLLEKAYGPDNLHVVTTLQGLGNVSITLGRYDKAEGYYKRIISTVERAFPPGWTGVAPAMTGLALVYKNQKRYAEAEQLYRRVLTLLEGVYGDNHAHVASVANFLATVLTAQDRAAEAEPYLKRTLAISERILGPNHKDTSYVLDDLAALEVGRNDYRAAIGYSRKAVAAVIAQSDAEAATGYTSGAQSLVERRQSYFRRHVTRLAGARGQGVEPAGALGSEAFEFAQWANQTTAARAVQQTAARFSTGGGELAALVRESQDTATAWRKKDIELVAALSKTEVSKGGAEIDRLRSELAALEGRLAASNGRLKRDFPDYSALANPRPASVSTVQQLLRADETLAFFLVGPSMTEVFAVTRNSGAWLRIELGEQELEAKVTAFRQGLDIADLVRATEGASSTALFDLRLASELYTRLLGPIESVFRGHLLIVPSGPLTALPFSLLVSEKSDIAPPMASDLFSADLSPYRQAAWLIKRQAVTVLPSVASLSALRSASRGQPAPYPMIGFGDPVFNPALADSDTRPAAIQTAELRAARPSPADRPQTPEDAQRSALRNEWFGGYVRPATRAYSAFWTRAGVDRRELMLALQELPDTADELKAVAMQVGASPQDIHLRRDASETTVKGAALDRYRIVYFATHGLVAGDIEGLGEPSLALSIPSEPTATDDGLLTASEVAQLKLNADWVVLSACNTIAGERPGAEALSGLARAFFYAGARALLVSHWSVASESATRLTVSTFDVLKSDPSLGRAEALRRAMLAYMADTSQPRNAYPAFWGPFSIIGEGSAR